MSVDDAGNAGAADRSARSDLPLAGVVVVLVRSQGAGNVGSVARLCANHGCTLRLVAPECDPLSREGRMFAASDVGLLEAAPRFADLGAAVADVDVVVGTSSKLVTARESAVLDVRNAGRLLPAAGERTALVFGNERDGLSVDEGALCHRVVRLRTPGEHNSLNLSHAVCAVLTLLLASTTTTTERLLAPRARERLIEDWLALLSGAGYFKLTTPALFRPRLARLVDTMHLDDRDAALLQGMLRALSSSDSASSPSPSPSSGSPS